MRIDIKNRNQITRMLLSLCLLTALSQLQVLAQTGDGTVFSVLPRLVFGQNVGSGVVLFNPTANQASAALTAKNADGSLLSNATVTIPPFGQIVTPAAALFPVTSLAQGSLSVASATNGLIAVYSTYGNNSAEGVEGPASSTQLLFPVIPGPSEGVVEIDLHNPSPRPTVAELNLWSFGGTLLGISSYYIPAGAVLQARPDQLFGTATDFSRASHITVNSEPINIFSQAQSLMGTSVLSGFSPFSGSGVDVGVLSARPYSFITNSGAIPYFRTGVQYASTLCLASIEPAGANVTVTLVGDSGATLGSRNITLAAMGGLRAPLQNLFASVGTGEHEGWILIQSSGRVNANILFGRSDAGAFSAIPMQSLPMASVIFPFAFNGSGTSMELSLVNPGSSPSNVGIYVVQPSGVTLAANQITISPGARISQSLHQLLPEIANLPGGYLYISATQPVFSTASLWSDDGTTVSNFTPQQPTTAFRPPALTSFAVTGRVTLNDNPAQGVQVVLSGPVDQTATSDADGLYAFKALPPGNYSMAIDHTGFEFLAAQVNFAITNASFRQDFQVYTAPNQIIVQPGSVAINSSDTSVDIFGNNFNAGSQVFANGVLLSTTFLSSTHLQAVIPAYMLTTPARFSIWVITGNSVTQSFSFAAFQTTPTLTSLDVGGQTPQIFAGSSGVTLTLNGTGFLPELIATVNGSSAGIQVNVLSSTQALAAVPASYFTTGGIYPVAVQNSGPSNTESNIQLLTVYYPSPEVQTISPNQVAVELEPGLGSVPIEVFGFGFKRGAVVLFNDGTNNEPLSTTYCEDNAYCLATHLHASIPASLLQASGYAGIAVQNPSPTLGSSGIQMLTILGLEPSITSILPGSASIRNTPGSFDMPVLVNGMNFGPQTSVLLTDPNSSQSEPTVTLLSSTQLLTTATVQYPAALGTWMIQVTNPGPGGGKSLPGTFTLGQDNFVGNPFLITIDPTQVGAGGPGFTLTLTGNNFQPGAQVQFYTTLLQPKLSTFNVLMVDIPAYLLQTAGKFPISVVNPGTGGNSNRLYLDVQ